MSRKKPSVLILIDWFAPGYLAGGPIRSVVNLVRSFSDEIDFSVITTDRDFGKEEPYEGIQANTWIDWEGHARVLYFSKDAISREVVINLIHEGKYDILHINSFFSPNFSLWPLYQAAKGKLQNKIIISPRGIFGEKALAHKGLKKKVFFGLFKRKRIWKQVLFHATDETEKNGIIKMFGEGVKVHVCPNIASMSAQTWQPKEKVAGKLKILFLARIVPIKNLNILLDAAKALKGDSIEISLCGPIEDPEYWKSCEAIIAGFPDHTRVTLKGSMPPAEIRKELDVNHILCLPTKGENFGHAIFESLSAGLPAVISDKTPWVGLEEKTAGYDLSLENPGSFAEKLQEFVEMDQEEYDRWSVGAWNVADNYLKKSQIRKKNLSLFQP